MEKVEVMISEEKRPGELGMSRHQRRNKQKIERQLHDHKVKKREKANLMEKVKVMISEEKTTGDFGMSRHQSRNK